MAKDKIANQAGRCALATVAGIPPDDAITATASPVSMTEMAEGTFDTCILNLVFDG